MEAEERRWVLSRISDYYRTAEFNIPELEKREVGVGLEKKIDVRHMSFSNTDELRNYLVNNPPFYISYSASYYELPSATPIEKKIRKGADLIFDLDMHADGKYEVYGKLEAVKQDTIRLAEEFLIPDFGLSKDEIFYVFSGNRGYHIHVRSKAVWQLGARERREMVDYIRGVGLDFRKFFEEGERKGQIMGPTQDSWGYRGRFVKKVLALLENNASSFYRGFRDEGRKKDFIEGISKGNWSRVPFSRTELESKLVPVAGTLPLLTVDADAAVTYDISKLIRMPNTIHGGTGFIAREVKDMGRFDPLKDALAFSSNPVKASFIEDVPETRLGDGHYSFRKGETREIPEYAAAFFLLKGSAKV